MGGAIRVAPLFPCARSLFIWCMEAKVYLITNLVNGKKYVGVTTKSLKKRFQQHLWDAKRRTRLVIHHAMKKYGESNFTIDLLEELSDVDEATVLLREAYYIGKYNTLIDDGCGYNMASYGGGNFNFSEATKQKMSELKGGKNHNADLTIRQFRHTKTGEIFSGTRYEFAQKYGLKKSSVDGFIQGQRRKTKGWILC